MKTQNLARHEAKCAGPKPAAQRSAKAKPRGAARTAPPPKTEPYCQQCGAPRASKHSFSGCDFWFCSDTCRSLFGNQLFQLARGDMLARGSRMATFGGRPAGTIAAYCYRCGTRHELPAVQRAVHEAVCRRCGGKLLP